MEVYVRFSHSSNYFFDFIALLLSPAEDPLAVFTFATIIENHVFKVIRCILSNFILEYSEAQNSRNLLWMNKYLSLEVKSNVNKKVSIINYFRKHIIIIFLY